MLNLLDSSLNHVQPLEEKLALQAAYYQQLQMGSPAMLKQAPPVLKRALGHTLAHALAIAQNFLLYRPHRACSSLVSLMGYCDLRRSFSTASLQLRLHCDSVASFLASSDLPPKIHLRQGYHLQAFQPSYTQLTTQICRWVGAVQKKIAEALKEEERVFAQLFTLPNSLMKA